MHPIAGHGGNACIESAAVLVNNLFDVLAESKGAKPSLEQIENVFSATQTARQGRTRILVEHSHQQQRSESLDTPLLKFSAFYLLPLANVEDVTFHFSRNMPLAEKLNTPNLSSVPRLIPYKDELLSIPRSRGLKKWYFIGFYLLVAAAVHYGMWVWSAHWGLDKHLGSILTTGQFTHDSSFLLKRQYTGVKPIDDYLTFLSAIFMTGVNNWDQNFGTLQIYFLGMLIQPIAISSVEAFRSRNALTPISL